MGSPIDPSKLTNRFLRGPHSPLNRHVRRAMKRDARKLAQIRKRHGDTQVPGAWAWFGTKPGEED